MTINNMILIETNDLIKLPDLSGSTIIRWHYNYWNGALSGYIELNGESGYWVQCIDDEWDFIADEADDFCKTECKSYQKCTKCDCFGEVIKLYAVLKLTKDQEDAICYNNALFEKYVGSHHRYDEKGHRVRESKLKPASEACNYYNYPETQKNVPDFKKNQIIGYTTSLTKD